MSSPVLPRFLLFPLFLLPSLAFSQEFGSNHLVLKDFDWKVSETEHFDIHYYDEGAAWVPFAARSLERSYARLSRALGTRLGERRPFFLYADKKQMQQSTIVEVGDGTGGVTEPFKERFMAYNDGSRRWLDAVATHELVHIFQYRVLLAGFWKSARILKTVVYPLWMMEGMAEYFTREQEDTEGEVVVRDAATSGGLIPLWKLEHFNHLKPHQVRLAYETGAKALEFLESQYGSGKVESLLKIFESHFESSSVLQALIGLDLFAFDKKWREFAEEHYALEARRNGLQEPEAYARPLTRQDEALPEFNTSPVFSPSGAFAYLSTREGHPPIVYWQEGEGGRRRKLFETGGRIDNIPLGNFSDLSRVLALSPDGRLLAFMGQRTQRDRLYLYDLEKGRLESVPIGLAAAAQPAFSPDGKTLAFSGMQDGFTDIYLLDLATRRLSRATSDPEDDQTPAFSPDGSTLVYASEREAPGESPPYQRRLYALNLKDGGVTRLSDFPGSAKDPVFSPDAKRLLFSMDLGGFQELCELDLSDLSLRRLTRSLGAAYTPAYTGAGEIAFAALRRGSVHLYAGARERFLSEPLGAGEGKPAAAGAEPAFAQVLQTRAYQPSYSTDLFFPAFFYSSEGGFFWTSYWQGSDLLGRHQAQSLLSYASASGYLSYQASYRYARFRPQISAGASGFVFNDNFDPASGSSLDESGHVQYVRGSYPIDRFKRVDLTLASITDEREYLSSGTQVRHDTRLGMLAFVRDTVRGRYLVAQRGTRARLQYAQAPRALGGHYGYRTASGEAHAFLPTGGLSALALRGFAVQSMGSESQRYPLGGLSGVRGYGRSTVRDVGSRLAVANAEWRVPVFANMDYYMWYIFPDFYFKALSLALFADTGYVWETGGELSRTGLRELRSAYGAGLRLHTFILQLFPLVVHFDYARRMNSKGGVFYVYLGPLF